MTSRKNWIIAKVASEGYCCLHAYLRLCKARGETVEDMAKNIQMSPHTIWYHYRKMECDARTAPHCMKISGCMDPVITSIEAEVTIKRLLQTKEL